MVNLTLLPYSPRLLLTSCSWFVLPCIPLDHHPQHGHASELLLLLWERHRLRGELSFYGHPPYHNRQECASSSSSPTRRVFTKKLNSTQCVSLSLVLILWVCRRLLLNTIIIIIILSTFRGNIITIFLAKF